MKHLWLLALLGACSPTNKSSDVMITVQTKDFKTELQDAQRMGFDIAGVNREKKTFSIVLPKDSESYFKEQVNKNVVKVDELRAPDSNYKTPDEVAALLRTYTGDHPDLAQLSIIGNSTEGRPIYAVKVTSNSIFYDANKRVVLFDSMHHAREVMTTEVALDIIDYLVTRYPSDPQVKNWLDTTEVWVVPMLNVDGNNKVWTGDSMWRKNTRGGYGVDINRNYPYAWNTCNGSSGSQGSETYRGPSAGSEPETQALMNLVAQIKPHIDVSFHTFSEIVIYPMGCSPQHVPAPDRAIVEGIGRELASKIVRDSGSGTYEAGTSYELLYNVDGGSIDWMYATHKVIPFVIEFNGDAQGFQPSYSRWRDITIQRARPGWQYILDRVHGELIQR